MKTIILSWICILVYSLIVYTTRSQLFIFHKIRNLKTNSSLLDSCFNLNHFLNGTQTWNTTFQVIACILFIHPNRISMRFGYSIQKLIAISANSIMSCWNVFVINVFDAFNTTGLHFPILIRHELKQTSKDTQTKISLFINNFESHLLTA